MLRRLLNLGSVMGLPKPFVRKVRTVNLASLLSILLFGFFCIVLFIRQLHLVGIVYAVFTVGFIAPLMLNQRQEYLAARFVMMALAAFALIAVEFLIESSTRGIFFICLMVLGIFLADNRKQSFLTFLAVVVLFVISRSVPYFFDVSDLRTESTIAYWMNLVFGSVGLWAMFDNFKADSLSHEQELARANLDLEVKGLEAQPHQRSLAEQALAMEKKNAELRAFNIEMQDSIRYARRIQASMLPTKEQLREWLPELMLLFKPKDILSGDFYWMAQADGNTYVAVADCTGHGVPGAMMTVLGNNLLHEAVVRDGLRSPASILTHIDLRVKEMLSQRTQDSGRVSDGMDMALLCLDAARTNATFAGARRPLIAFHGTGSELTAYAGTRLSIGSAMPDQRAFTDVHVTLRQGDMLYLYTDGFTDQLGPQGKYLTTRFRNLLRDIHRRSIPEQHRMLNEALLRWKVAEPQTDDILIIGVKV
jgi:serine phosphatase RsbU (regulator of sigma subunit)